MKLKKVLMASIIGTIGFSSLSTFASEQVQQDNKAVKLAVLSDTSELVVKVLSVNYKEHTLTLEGVDGKPTVFMVAPKVDISNIVDGDVLKAVGAQSVVISVMKVGKDVTPGAAESMEVKVSSKNDKLPFEEVVKTLYITAKVLSYNSKTSEVEIETPTHHKVTMKVDKSVKELANGKVKVGDEILLTYSQGFLIGVYKN